MKTIYHFHNTPFQLALPIDLSILIKNDDLVVLFCEIINNVNLQKYIHPRNTRGRLGYDAINLLKVILFGFTLEGYASLRKLEDLCRNDIRFMFLMKGKTPSHMTFSNFINNYLTDNIENIFVEINKVIFEKDNEDLSHLYLDGSKFEAKANKYSWVWKKSCLTNRLKLFSRVTDLLKEINLNLLYPEGITFELRENIESYRNF